MAGEAVAKAEPDGYTLLLGNDTMLVVNPHLYKMSFDPLTGLIPVASVVSNQFYISIGPSLGPKTLREFIDFARASRPSLAYGSAGVGSMHHLSMELLKQHAGIDLQHVPYRGGSAAVTGVLSGEVQAISSGGSSAPLITAGQLRGIATTGRNRSSLFPDLPAVAELFPGYEATIWLGLFAPVGTPEWIIERLRSETNKVLAMPDVSSRMQTSSGMDPFVSAPEAFASLIRSDYEKYGTLIRTIGLSPRP